ncbi:hypothetical protein [Rosistilla oblonga]|uniref:hypothetical protein n=1 Tax=Rosistilla oblonga TaxID=2527990 RepID=UPI003A9735FF
MNNRLTNECQIPAPMISEYQIPTPTLSGGLGFLWASIGASLIILSMGSCALMNNQESVKAIFGDCDCKEQIVEVQE